MPRRPPGVTLVETMAAMVVLVFAFLVVFNLFHASIRYAGQVQNQVFASIVADRRIEEIREWATARTAGQFNYDQSWAAVAATSVDPNNPQYRIAVQVGNVEVFTPSTLLELSQPLAERRKMAGCFRRVLVTVSWGETGETGKSISRMALVRDPPRRFRSADPLVVTPTAPIPATLPKDAQVEFTVVGYDSDGTAIKGLQYYWALIPMTGNATLTQPRTGARAIMTNAFTPPDGATIYTGGKVKLRVRAMCGGKEATEDTDEMELEN